MTRATAHDNVHLERFAELEQELLRRGPEWLRSARRAGRARFDALGFPTPDLEEWKNTNVSAIANTPFRPFGEGGIAKLELPAPVALDLGGPRLIFVNGRLAAEPSSVSGLPEGVWIGSLADALASIPERIESHLPYRPAEESGAFAALNTALFEDGGVVLVPDGVTLERPVSIVFVSGGGPDPSACHPRTLVVAGRESRVSIVESYTSAGEGLHFTNASTFVHVGENASVEHCRLQMEGTEAHHVSDLESRQEQNSRYRGICVTLGGRLVRNDLRAVLEGEGAEGIINGLYLTRGRQHVDNHTVIDHARPHCDSRELYKGILADRSRTVFNGRIVVRPDAQKTDAKQSNPNLLLSDGALSHTRPQLEIYADDVKCTHGATVGRLDAEAIFYLRSRGLTEADARNLLVHAFAGEVLERLEIEPLRELLEDAVAQRLPGGDGRG